MTISIFITSIILCLSVAFVLSKRMGVLPSKNHFPVDGRVRTPPGRNSWLLLTENQTVLITGGSQGLGKSAARILAQKGANVIIVARNSDKLRAAIVEISVRTSSISLPPYSRL